MAGAGSCRNCGKTCSSKFARADLATGGFPCQPFSGMRSDMATTPPHKHKDFQTLVDFVRCIAARRPHGGVVENVMGFLKLLDGTDDEGRPLPESWATWLMQNLKDLGYFAQCVKLNNDLWSEIPRERLSICTLFECGDFIIRKLNLSLFRRARALISIA
jgi:site-specific DNA-cytosine methylase